MVTYIAGTSLLISAVVLSAALTFALFEKYAIGNGSYGEISLRSYFECGSGRLPKTNGPDDPGDPYVITRPRHLYNLSRLQSLGVFGEEKYFQLGLEGLAGDTSGNPLCYLNDSSNTVVPFLDMSASTYTYEPINAIGSEAVPFYGEFNGQGLEIKNLTVYADPEDAGLFGYTAHGSSIHDLFLSEVTINALGYTDAYENLYGASSAAVSGTSFVYQYGEDTKTFTPGDETIKQLEFDASDIFNWDEEHDPEPEVTDVAPTITFTSTNPNYKYKILISGDFLIEDGNGGVTIDLPTLYKFYKKERVGATGYINSSSTLSLVASTTDNYGLDHSKVVLTYEFDFTLGSSESTTLIMRAHLGENHTNNIGLLVGHCDGSVKDCYAHNGYFVMNNGQAVATAAGIDNVHYNMMANNSSYGLIGLIGGTVHNIAAEESDATTKAGKAIGVLDFSTVYDQIIDDNSFVGTQTFQTGKTYIPASTATMYNDYLRINSSGQYITSAVNEVSFNRQKIISNTDLGIFTVATDYTGTGMYDDAANGLDRCVVKKEDVSINSNSYYVYYATGEYEKDKGVAFSEYTDSLKTDNPTEFHVGHHLPYYDTTTQTSNITSESFEQRDRHQNYFFRFKVDGNYRSGKGFYFSDVDKKTAGGDFISKYFENRLVDQNGNKIPASADSNRSGVMLRNSLGQEIRKFSSSFATPNLTGNQKMYCIYNEDTNPAANMVNFEIKTNVANVTVIAGLANTSKPAALGVYKIDGVQRKTDGNLRYINKAYDDPDYAFFMPTDSRLAYFDYMVNNDGKGKIGVYDTAGNFTEATGNTNATVAKAYGLNNEYGYQSGKTRLYCHTFKLPKGSYCLGSASGASDTGLAKLYYVCAQGQTDGQIEFDDNAFASQDEVKNIDFTKVERYTYNQQSGTVTTNIEIGDVTVYDPNSKLLENQRCYVALTNSDRSRFNPVEGNLSFVYEDNKFKISSTTLSAIEYISVTTYGSSHGIDGLGNTTVKLFNLADYNGNDALIYPTQ